MWNIAIARHIIESFSRIMWYTYYTASIVTQYISSICLQPVIGTFAFCLAFTALLIGDWDRATHRHTKICPSRTCPEAGVWILTDGVEADFQRSHWIFECGNTHNNGEKANNNRTVLNSSAESALNFIHKTLSELDVAQSQIWKRRKRWRLRPIYWQALASRFACYSSVSVDYERTPSFATLCHGWTFVLATFRICSNFIMNRPRIYWPSSYTAKG